MKSINSNWAICNRAVADCSIMRYYYSIVNLTILQLLYIHFMIHPFLLWFCEYRFNCAIYILGGIQQLRGHNFAIFSPPPLHGQFLYPERGQKQTFFDSPLPLVHLVIECPLTSLIVHNIFFEPSFLLSFHCYSKIGNQLA